MITDKPPFAGPWSSEPDGPVFWVDETTGYECAAARNGSYVWCGYVRSTAPQGQSASYDNLDVHVHGGLTYGGTRFPEHGGFWYGFDCAHSGDYIPSMHKYYDRIDRRKDTVISQYRTLEFVKKECESVARQLKAIHDRQ